MKIAVAEEFHGWIGSVAHAIAKLLDRYTSAGTVTLIQAENNEFILQLREQLPNTAPSPQRIQFVDGEIADATRAAASLCGCRVEMTLQPCHFMFRPLELPARAADFLNGIVRTQIDRLTPWNAADAAFGWSQPIAADADRVVVTVAATAQATVKPYVQAITSVGARSIAVYAAPRKGDPDTVPIKVWDERVKGALDIGRIHKLLVVILCVAAAIAAVTIGLTSFEGSRLDAQQAELAQQIASARAAAGARGAASNSTITAERTLEQRKRDGASIVIAIEGLSRILPDHTHLTELRVEGNRVRLIGTSADAPSLIGLIEKSGLFSRATFIAPTTKSPSEAGERFHIEAIIEPLFPARS